MTVKLSHERKVRSLAKKTFGSTRVGRAIFLPRRELCQYTRWDAEMGWIGKDKIYPERLGGEVGTTLCLTVLLNPLK